MRPLKSQSSGVFLLSLQHTLLSSSRVLLGSEIWTEVSSCSPSSWIRGPDALEARGGQAVLDHHQTPGKWIASTHPTIVKKQGHAAFFNKGTEQGMLCLRFTASGLLLFDSDSLSLRWCTALWFLWTTRLRAGGRCLLPGSGMDPCFWCGFFLLDQKCCCLQLLQFPGLAGPWLGMLSLRIQQELPTFWTLKTILRTIIRTINWSGDNRVHSLKRWQN